MSKVLVLYSGGLDSTVLAYDLCTYNEVELVSFDYGQRHRKMELHAAQRIANLLNVRWDTVGLYLQRLGIPQSTLFLNSALTDSTIPVPEGPYTERNLQATVVPNRNSIMANIAAGIAISRGMDAIALAVHAGDHPVYLDCRPAFVDALRALLEVSTGSGLNVLTPYIGSEKWQLVKLGNTLGVPFSLTWSCYKGGPVHCGKCSTCIERKEAFKLAGVKDPTAYKRSKQNGYY